MKSKNPYELRFEMFKEAQKRAEMQFYEDMQDYRTTFTLAQEGRNVEILPKPKYPDLEAVFQEAYKIKQFVENKEH